MMSIDYGEKRVGIASTDETGAFALPREVLPNDSELLPTVIKMAEEWQVERVVVGESKNFKGEDNAIMKAARFFAADLEAAGLSIVFHPEMLTSLEAKQIQGKNDMLDASAAALILKSYIDTHD
ncbi:Holliday junction resolvase RuvX [Candidatus Parcubacteria bacterium]|nr:Holliday junction resolvase RuvX [Candidatus Parcubacteria bacterium]